MVAVRAESRHPLPRVGAVTFWALSAMAFAADSAATGDDGYSRNLSALADFPGETPTPTQLDEWLDETGRALDLARAWRNGDVVASRPRLPS